MQTRVIECRCAAQRMVVGDKQQSRFRLLKTATNRFRAFGDDESARTFTFGSVAVRQVDTRMIAAESLDFDAFIQILALVLIPVGLTKSEATLAFVRKFVGNAVVSTQRGVLFTLAMILMTQFRFIRTIIAIQSIIANLLPRDAGGFHVRIILIAVEIVGKTTTTRFDRQIVNGRLLGSIVQRILKSFTSGRRRVVSHTILFIRTIVTIDDSVAPQVDWKANVVAFELVRTTRVIAKKFVRSVRTVASQIAKLDQSNATAAVLATKFAFSTRFAREAETKLETN